MKTSEQKSASSNSPAAAPAGATTIVQPKLTINEPGDRYEQEADAMADRVMRMPATPPADASAAPGLTPLPLGGGVYRKCADCEKEEKLHRKEAAVESPAATPLLMRKTASGGGVATPALTQQLSQSKGGGSPLPLPTLQTMSQAFGADFSGVRVHTGSAAAQMNQGIQARAFTHGADIYFNRGEYRPESGEGKRLLAHELGHVVQQGFSDNQSFKQGMIQKTSANPDISGTWPPANPTPKPLNEVHKKIAQLLGSHSYLFPVLKISYMEHDRNKEYLKNSFYWPAKENDVSSWPPTLWNAIENIGNRMFVKSIVDVSYIIRGKYPELWPYVMRILSAWDDYPSSNGFSFDTLGHDDGLEAALNKSKSLCRDSRLTAAIFHSGQDCWRDMTGKGGEGLHFCMGKKGKPNVHIDPHEPTTGKDILGNCQYTDIPKLGKHLLDVATPQLRKWRGL